MAGFLGSGDLYFRRTVGGVVGGWNRFGNATKLEIKENSDKKERISKQVESYGDALDTVYIKKPTTIDIMLDDINHANLTLAFLGTEGTTSVAAGAAVSEAQTVVTVGTSVQLLNGNASAVVVKDVTDTTTYTVDVDYRVLDADLGLIFIIEGGAIASGDVLHISYSYAARTSSTIEGGTDSNIVVELMMKGENYVDQSKVKLAIYKAVLSPTAGIDFLDSNFATIPLAGTLVRPTDRPSSYLVETDVT